MVTHIQCCLDDWKVVPVLRGDVRERLMDLYTGWKVISLSLELCDKYLYSAGKN